MELAFGKLGAVINRYIQRTDTEEKVPLAEKFRRFWKTLTKPHSTSTQSAGVSLNSYGMAGSVAKHPVSKSASMSVTGPSNPVGLITPSTETVADTTILFSRVMEFSKERRGKNEPPRFEGSLEKEYRVTASTVCEEDQIADGDENAVLLSCFVQTNVQDVVFLWMKDSNEIYPTDRFLILSQSRATLLRINYPRLSDSGVYSCVAANPEGRCETVTNLIVEPAVTETNTSEELSDPIPPMFDITLTESRDTQTMNRTTRCSSLLVSDNRRSKRFRDSEAITDRLNRLATEKSSDLTSPLTAPPTADKPGRSNSSSSSPPDTPEEDNGEGYTTSSSDSESQTDIRALPECDQPPLSPQTLVPNTADDVPVKSSLLNQSTPREKKNMIASEKVKTFSSQWSQQNSESVQEDSKRNEITESLVKFPRPKSVVGSNCIDQGESQSAMTNSTQFENRRAGVQFSSARDSTGQAGQRVRKMAAAFELSQSTATTNQSPRRCSNSDRSGVKSQNVHLSGLSSEIIEPSRPASLRFNNTSTNMGSPKYRSTTEQRKAHVKSPRDKNSNQSEKTVHDSVLFMARNETAVDEVIPCSIQPDQENDLLLLFPVTPLSVNAPISAGLRQSLIDISLIEDTQVRLSAVNGNKQLPLTSSLPSVPKRQSLPGTIESTPLASNTKQSEVAENSPPRDWVKRLAAFFQRRPTQFKESPKTHSLKMQCEGDSGPKVLGADHQPWISTNPPSFISSKGGMKENNMEGGCEKTKSAVGPRTGGHKDIKGTTSTQLSPTSYPVPPRIEINSTNINNNHTNDPEVNPLSARVGYVKQTVHQLERQVTPPISPKTPEYYQTKQLSVPSVASPIQRTMPKPNNSKKLTKPEEVRKVKRRSFIDLPDSAQGNESLRGMNKSTLQMNVVLINRAEEIEVRQSPVGMRRAEQILNPSNNDTNERAQVTITRRPALAPSLLQNNVQRIASNNNDEKPSETVASKYIPSNNVETKSTTALKQANQTSGSSLEPNVSITRSYSIVSPRWTNSGEITTGTNTTRSDEVDRNTQSLKKETTETGSHTVRSTVFTSTTQFGKNSSSTTAMSTSLNKNADAVTGDNINETNNITTNRITPTEETIPTTISITSTVKAHITTPIANNTASANKTATTTKIYPTPSPKVTTNLLCSNAKRNETVNTPVSRTTTNITENNFDLMGTKHNMDSSGLIAASTVWNKPMDFTIDNPKLPPIPPPHHPGSSTAIAMSTRMETTRPGQLVSSEKTKKSSPVQAESTSLVMQNKPKSQEEITPKLQSTPSQLLPIAKLMETCERQEVRRVNLEEMRASVLKLPQVPLLEEDEEANGE
ncbi:unnamed protein product [Echinostoma caproni]|uniref:Ig-like domain-containing protein n=1 Tax=Echinostoma caproni TaxID=27848 RepID=A0A183ABS5_9TREM|nr:unnamed protein product [Echinostoma caproni]